MSTIAKKKKPGHARTSKVATVNVIVVAENGHGKHEKGTVLPMHKTTAAACVASGVVEYTNKKPTK